MPPSIADKHSRRLHFCIHAGILSNAYATDTVVLIDHLTSSTWRRVCISFDTGLLRSGITSPTALDTHTSPEDLITSWSAIDEALSRSNYDGVTEVVVNWNELEVDALPPGYHCANELFAKLLPHQMERGRLKVQCYPDDSCPHHRYA